MWNGLHTMYKVLPSRFNSSKKDAVIYDVSRMIRIPLESGWSIKVQSLPVKVLYLCGIRLENMSPLYYI